MVLPILHVNIRYMMISSYNVMGWHIAGVDPPVKPVTRFDVIRWDHFDEDDIFLDDDFSNIRKLEGLFSHYLQWLQGVYNYYNIFIHTIIKMAHNLMLPLSPNIWLSHMI